MTASYTVLVPALLATAVLVWPERLGPRNAERLRSMVQPDASARRAAATARRPLGLRRVVGRAPRRRAGLPVDLVMDLVACGLRAGLSLEDALAAGARAQARAGPPAAEAAPSSGGLAAVVAQLAVGVAPDIAWGSASPELRPLARAMLLAQLSGAPAADVVARAAVDVREARRQRAELAAARLGVRLVLPLGLAILPGFVLLSVVPIVLGLATSVLGVQP
jgi:Type II secretion system (T2SS), protein F